MSTLLEKTQKQLLQHHGGNAFKARQAINNSYENRHDSQFWVFWDDFVASNYLVGDGILDMGCGSGMFVRDCAQRYPQSQVYGIDAAPYMLQTNTQLPTNATLFMDDLHQPQAPIDNDSLAMIMANTVIHELSQPIRLFLAAHKWLKPGGRLCVIEGIRQPLETYLEKRYTQKQIWRLADNTEELAKIFTHYFEHNRYDKEDLIYLGQSAGFKLVLNTWELNSKLISLVFEK